MIRVACPHCQRTFRTTTEGMGITAVCSGCHQSFRIGSARPPFAWKPTSLAEDSWIGVSPPEQDKREIKHCIICDAPLEDEAIRCLACGANQITGLVHKSRTRPAEEVRVPLWSILPVKPLIILLLVAAVGTGLFLGIKSMVSAALDDGLEMLQVRLIREAARHLAAGMEPEEFAAKYRGRVDDNNVSRFLEMLDAGDVTIRNAAAPLIACGKVARVQPIVARAQSAEANVAAGAIKVLQAIGPHRLVELSCDADEKVRQPAAEALFLMFKISPDPARLESLSAEGKPAEKIELLNKLCRAWPRATGHFTITIDDQVAPMTAMIEQVGRMFYLHLGTKMFASNPQAERQFTIPIAQWCAATGVAVDTRQVRTWIDGEIMLASPFGAGWEGEVRVKALQKLSTAPPGFLPIDTLDRNEMATLPIVLTQQ